MGADALPPNRRRWGLGVAFSHCFGLRASESECETDRFLTLFSDLEQPAFMRPLRNDCGSFWSEIHLCLPWIHCPLLKESALLPRHTLILSTTGQLSEPAPCAYRTCQQKTL